MLHHNEFIKLPEMGSPMLQEQGNRALKIWADVEKVSDYQRWEPCENEVQPFTQSVRSSAAALGRFFKRFASRSSAKETLPTAGTLSAETFSKGDLNAELD
jgi:hypothetical protein